jgi:plasmid stability protein
MSATMLQVRSIPPDLQRRLKARAALEGLTMSDFVLRELRKALERPMREEVLARLRAQPVRRVRKSAADIIRAERDSR